MAVANDHRAVSSPAPSAAAVPTAAAAWKRNVPELHTLPSGNEALLVRRSVMQMIKAGEVPNPLMSVAMSAATKTERDIDFQQASEFLDWMVAMAFVEPRCVIEGEPGTGEIHVDWLDDSDRTYVLRWVQRDIRVAAPFPADGSGAAGGGDGGGVRDEAE